MRIYLVYTGKFGGESYLRGIYQYKKDAIKKIKSLPGFTYNKRDDLYENHSTRIWYRIDKDTMITNLDKPWKSMLI